MLDTVLTPKPNDTPGDPLGCLLAAGMDPDGRNLDNVLITMRSSEALSKCMSGVPTFEYWKGMAATLLLLAVAAAVYWWTPRLRELRQRTVPVGDVDTDGTLAAELAELRARAGITYGLAFRVEPARTTAGAVVYGRFGNYTVCLHAGLLVRRSTDPEGFRAVVLHELAHIRNRDVDFASASTALWRVFVVLALLPYLYHEGRLLLRGLFGTADSPFWPGTASTLAYSLLAGLVLVGLVHLARADLLRRRELHADAGAVDYGASPAAWQHRDPPGTVAASVRRVTALLRTHPTWAERRRALADHTRLSGVGALSMFLVGVSATLLVNALQVVPGLSADSGAAWCTAAFMAPMLWFPLARSVAASQGPGQGESGVRSGMWLGCGLVLGEFARGRHGNEWLAPEPWFLLGLLLAATVAAVWSAQCTRLALALPRRWARRAAGLLNLLVVAAVLGTGLRWWYWAGQYLAVGVYNRTDLLRHRVTSTFPGRWQAYSRELSAYVTLQPNLVALTKSIPVEAAALALWLVPLVVWACTGTPGLRVRRTLLAGLAGGALCWAARGRLRPARPPPRPPGGTHRCVRFLPHLAGGMGHRRLEPAHGRRRGGRLPALLAPPRPAGGRGGPISRHSRVVRPLLGRRLPRPVQLPDRPLPVVAGPQSEPPRPDHPGHPGPDDPPRGVRGAGRCRRGVGRTTVAVRVARTAGPGRSPGRDTGPGADTTPASCRPRAAKAEAALLGRGPRAGRLRGTVHGGGARVLVRCEAGQCIGTGRQRG
ncbi:M48 family metalloprotease [Streptomyces sp. NPDC003015]